MAKPKTNATKKPSTRRDGAVAAKVMDLLNKTAWSNRRIAEEVGCAISYVYNLRKKMVHVEPCSEELTPELKEVLHAVTSGTGRTAPESVPEDAHDLVITLTARGSRYGPFAGHAEVTQKLKMILKEHMNERLESGDTTATLDWDQMEALEMICHKLGRIVNGDPHYADSWVDIAGYAKLVADRLEGIIR